MDLSMMDSGGMERTQRQWHDLLEGMGLTIIRMDGPRPSSLSRDGVLEAVYVRRHL